MSYFVPNMGQRLDIEALENIVAVARAGSISAAARVLGQPKQSVSRRLLALEAQLGVRLLERTTRALQLTAEGHALCDRAERILADLSETQQLIAERAHEPEGPLRVSAPMLLGQTILGTAVATYCRRYPKVDLDVELSDRKVDLVEEGIDVALRVGLVLDTSLIARLLATTELILVASPRYLAEHGTPVEPADLRNHAAIVAPSRAPAPDWLLERGRQRVAATARRCCRVSSLKLAAEIVAAGTGIAMLPESREPAALARLADLQEHQQLLDRPLVFVDMRLGEFLIGFEVFLRRHAVGIGRVLVGGQFFHAGGVVAHGLADLGLVG